MSSFASSVPTNKHDPTNKHERKRGITCLAVLDMVEIEERKDKRKPIIRYGSDKRQSLLRG
jgi:hypothetical protein